MKLSLALALIAVLAVFALRSGPTATPVSEAACLPPPEDAGISKNTLLRFTRPGRIQAWNIVTTNYLCTGALVTVTDEIPELYEYAAAFGKKWNCTNNANTVTCTTFSGPGAFSSPLYIVGRALTCGTASNQASATFVFGSDNYDDEDDAVADVLCPDAP